MNDEELFLSQDEVTDYIAEFKKDSYHTYGYEQEEFGICPYITFYIYHQDNEVEEIANKIDEPLSNVKIKLLRAKKLLAEIIQNKR